MHCSPVAQARPHAPQLVVLVCRFTQVLAGPPGVEGHADWPLGHIVTHAPLLHACPGPQTIPQPPQFAPSVAVRTQRLPHRTKPCAALHRHWPLLQPCAPAPHALPQLPQLFTSNPVLVQVPLQLVRKPAHIVTQLPN